MSSEGFWRSSETQHRSENKPESFDPNRRIDTTTVHDAFKQFFNPDQRIEKLYTAREDRIAQARGTDCNWRGEPGNSLAVPNTDTEKGRLVANILAGLKLEGIRYRDGVVDFSKCARMSIQIEGMTGSCLKDGDDCGNFRRANEALAEKWNKENPRPDGKKWTAEDVRKWAKAEGLTIHECSDMTTIQYVPKEIHAYFKHYGGRAECKARDRMIGAIK